MNKELELNQGSIAQASAPTTRLWVMAPRQGVAYVSFECEYPYQYFLLLGSVALVFSLTSSTPRLMKSCLDIHLRHHRGSSHRCWHS